MMAAGVMQKGRRWRPLRVQVRCGHCKGSGNSAAWLAPDRLQAIAGFGAQMFVAAVAIALPVTLILLLVHLVQVFVWGAYKKPRELT